MDAPQEASLVATALPCALSERQRLYGPTFIHIKGKVLLHIHTPSVGLELR